MTERWDLLIGYWGVALLLFIFSKALPKRAPFGQEQYMRVEGFKEFIRKAEKDKLEELVNQNPDYFGLTLSYAIAFGMANGWVAKFDQLLSAPPDYYVPMSGRGVFDAVLFNQMITSNLSEMSSSMNSTPAPSGGSYSGGGGYSGGSFSSGSSYSGGGGSSFSSGGGSSGGGFGGGGGGSW